MCPVQWVVASTCQQCGTAREEQRQVDKYRELYQMLMMQGSKEMSDMSFDYLSAWCAGEMSSVFATT